MRVAYRYAVARKGVVSMPRLQYFASPTSCHGAASRRAAPATLFPYSFHSFFLHMAFSDDTLGGRLPLLPPDDLSAEQLPVYQQISDALVPWAEQAGFRAETTDGKLIGPFNAMLRSPVLSMAQLHLTRTEQAHTTLAKTVREVVILTVGAVWQSAYELYAHQAVAEKAGLAPEAIRQLAAGQRPLTLSAAENVAYDFTYRLATAHQIDDALYAQGLATFGEQGLVDLVCLAGQYMTISSLLNTFAVPAPGA